MTRRHLLQAASLLGAGLLSVSSLEAAALAEPVPASVLSPGKGSLTFTDPIVNPGKPLTVWYYLPGDKKADKIPILFVMHGTLRNGETYRDQWADIAQKQGVLLLVPEFSRDDYPGGKYNRGNVLGQNDEAPQPPDTWTFAVLERVFDRVKTLTGSSARQYDIYGHSAGGQFVHRLALLMPQARYRRAVAANAGYYTLPTIAGLDPYPFSLKATPATAETLKKDFGRELIILLGEEDRDPKDPDLYHSPEADKQGLHRFARGQYFYKMGKDAASAAGARFGWKLVTVAGVGHSNELMAAAAAESLYGKKR
jgi:pimeloyl-ACP methyl ester carboxylesterase